MKMIIGLTGEMGSGKGTAAQYIEEKYKASSYRFSKILIKILDILRLEHIRKYTSGISTLLRKEYGDDIFSKVMAEDVREDGNNFIVIDGMRTLSDVKYLRKIPNFKFVFVEAETEKRFERIKKRNENPDDESKTFKGFLREHNLETEIGIRDLKQHADFAIDNNGTKEELFQKIEHIINGELTKTNES